MSRAEELPIGIDKNGRQNTPMFFHFILSQLFNQSKNN